MVNSLEDSKKPLSENAVESPLHQSLRSGDFRNQRVLVIITNATRTAPIPVFFRLITRILDGHASQLDFIVALGTHPQISQTALLRLVGLSKQEKAEKYAHIGLWNHRWDDPDAHLTLATIDADEMHQLSGSLIQQPLPITINRRILDYDVLLICGPVYPHGVVGFSGGNKYFFPWVSGAQIIDITHWVGALLTSCAIIGTFTTPVYTLGTSPEIGMYAVGLSLIADIISIT